ncbi:23S rRNA (guanosine(2251)-2'-O)-methyltransferase RlmB [bacterium]|nr:23S rRNA (guanosine(2251)-2'-O)-methyltransferase RlmB [bacterium]
MSGNQYIFGRRAVVEALRFGASIEEIWIAKNAHGEAVREIRNLAEPSDIHIKETDVKKIDSTLPGKNHQGILAKIVSFDFHYAELDDILMLAEQRHEKPLVAILDEITDPHNLGAIIRSAECAGFHGIIIPKHRSADVNSTVMKTSAGAVMHMHIIQATNLTQAIEWLKEKGLWIYGTDALAEKMYYEIDPKDGVGIIIGSEGKGMRKTIYDHCDFLIKIPMHGKLQSLNASVAAGIIFFDVIRRRSTNS